VDVVSVVIYHVKMEEHVYLMEFVSVVMDSMELCAQVINFKFLISARRNFVSALTTLLNGDLVSGLFTIR
jgi:hypothetical protein